MASETPGSDRLREAYATLLERRAALNAPPEISVEDIQALASGTYDGTDRNDKLEIILSDARTAAEFQFFLDLARERPAPERHVPGWMKAAAAVVLLTSGALFARAITQTQPDALRSAEGAMLALPEPGATMSENQRFVWHSVQNAEDYRLEVIAEDGTAVFESTVSDTVATLPPTITPRENTPHLWWVTARLRDGTEARSEARSVRFAR